MEFWDNLSRNRVPQARHCLPSVSPDLCDPQGQSILQYACVYCHEIVPDILAAGACVLPSTTSQDRWPIFDYLSQWGDGSSLVVAKRLALHSVHAGLDAHCVALAILQHPVVAPLWTTLPFPGMADFVPDKRAVGELVMELSTPTCSLTKQPRPRL